MWPRFKIGRFPFEILGDIFSLKSQVRKHWTNTLKQWHEGDEELPPLEKM